MKTIQNTAMLREQIRQWRRNDKTIALVPTMGALHQGHLSLVSMAREKADHVVASIFVNPTQFGAGEDLDRYPRQEAVDAELLQQTGCDLLFLPDVDTIYPWGFATTVHVDGITDVMEGRLRPGHFDGVTTIVSKLLLLTLPDMAIFGEKDWQQLAVVRRMTIDLNIPVEVIGAPIIRDVDGLALSSRNAYLNPDDRKTAGLLPRTLQQTAEDLARGADAGPCLKAAKTRLHEAGFAVDYLLLADGNNLQTLDRPQPGARLFVAASIGRTRLIDNMPVPVTDKSD